MPITFEDARRIAAATLSAHWGYEVVVEPWGRENAEAFLVVESHEPGLVQMGAPAVFVSRVDGSVDLVPTLAAASRIDAMRPVGATRRATA